MPFPPIKPLSTLLLVLTLLSFFPLPKTAHAAILSKAPNNLSLAGYWSFDEGVGIQQGDRSGNGRTATSTAATWITGKYGKALSFDGSTSFVDTNVDLSWSLSDSFSMSAWVKSTEAGGNNDSIVSKDNWEYIFYKNGPTIGFNHWNTAGGDVITMTGTVSDVSIWHHALVTYDGSVTTGKLYIDGVLVATDNSNAGTLQNRAETTKIGKGYAWSAGDGFMNGSIDDVRIYNRALSVTDASNLYRAGQVTRKVVSSNGLVGYWPLNEGVGYTAGDASGKGYTGTVSGLTWADGKRGKALSFASSASANNVLTSSFTPITSTLTMSAWIYPTSYPSERSTIIQGQTPNGFYMSLNSDGSLQTYWYSKSVVGYHSSGASTVPLNTWSHVAVVWNTDGPYLYVNGILKYNTASTGTGDAPTVINIGAESAARQFVGKIDDVRIYNRALSTAEVLSLSKQTETAVNHSQNTRATDGLVGLWSFNGPDYNRASTTAEVLERSGRSFNGDASNTPVTTIGKVGQALKFDGTDDHVLIAADDTNFLTGATGTLSFSFWMKPVALGGTILSRRHPCNNDGHFRIYINGSTINLSFYSNLDTGTFAYSSGNILSTGEWQHIGITKKWGTASSTKLYLNGIAQTFTPSGNDAAQGTTYTALQEIIGAEASTSNCNTDSGPKGNFFNGSIDEVRIYNRVLSATEILQLYNMGK